MIQKSQTKRKINSFILLVTVFTLILSISVTVSNIKNPSGIDSANPHNSLQIIADDTPIKELPQITVSEILSPGETILALSPDSEIAVTYKSSTISVWDLSANKKLFSLNSNIFYPTCAFYPDSSKVIIRATHAEYLLVDIAESQVTAIKDKMQGTIIAVSGDGGSIITSNIREINIYDSSAFDLKELISLGNFRAVAYNKSKNEVTVIAKQYISGRNDMFAVRILDMNGRMIRMRNQSTNTILRNITMTQVSHIAKTDAIVIIP